MPIVLTFQTKAGNERISKGPYSSIRLEGGLIREHAGGPVIASHFPEGWKVDGKDYLRVDSDASVMVVWDGCPPGVPPGSTGHFSSVDGVAYIDRRIFAFVDLERNDWYLKREGYHRPVLVLEPAR